MIRGPLVALAALLLAALAGPMSAAATRDFAVRDGESLADLAERLYGRREMAGLLERAGHPTEPVAGETLTLPVAERTTLPRGSSLSRVARRRTGRAERWPVLAALSGIRDPERCAPGTELIVPARLTIRVRRGDSLAKLARLAWGSTEGAGLLARWNGLPPRGWLRVGARLEVPLSAPFPEAARPPQPPKVEAMAEPEPAAPSPEWLIERLAERRRRGEPEGLLRLAQAILNAGARGSVELRVAAAREAAHALVALGRSEEAAALLRAQLPRGTPPDAGRDSPRIRELWPTTP